MAFPSKWAILIGPTVYEHVKPLKYCTNDIVEVSKALKEYAQFDHVLEFGTGLPLVPTRDCIFHELGSLRQSGNVGENDLLIFYFSGHGFRDKKDYLLPVGASPHNLKQTGIAVEDLVEELSETHCKNIVMFLDACREDIDGGKGVNSIGEESKQIVERAGIATFFSCEPAYLSYEIDELKHGAFTHCFLNAVRSGTCLTVAEVYEYLKREVPLTNTRFNKQVQRPYAIIQPDDKRDLPILLSDRNRGQSRERLSELMDQLGTLYTEPGGKIPEPCFNAAIEFLDSLESTPTGDQERSLLGFIERVCSGKLGPRAFVVLWDATMRRRTGTTSPVRRDLDKLQ